MKAIGVFLALVTMLLLSSCTSRPAERPALASVPGKYDVMTCEQLSSEADRVSAEIVTKSGMDMKADANPAKAALTFLFSAEVYLARKYGGDSTEVKRLRAELTAIKQHYVTKNCATAPAVPDPQQY